MSTFNSLTPSQHLDEGKSGLTVRDMPSVETAMRHVAAVPRTSPEAKEAAEVEAQLKSRWTEIRQERNAVEQARKSRASAIAQLQTDLKNLGYDLSVSDYDGAGEIAITSSNFDDTDHRVRFLAFLRGRNSPTSGICWMGIKSIRLRGSGFFLRFNETYPFSCDH
jgi:hypothetical protein